MRNVLLNKSAEEIWNSIDRLHDRAAADCIGPWSTMHRSHQNDAEGNWRNLKKLAVYNDCVTCPCKEYACTGSATVQAGCWPRSSFHEKAKRLIDKERAIGKSTGEQHKSEHLDFALFADAEMHLRLAPVAGPKDSKVTQSMMVRDAGVVLHRHHLLHFVNAQSLLRTLCGRFILIGA